MSVSRQSGFTIVELLIVLILIAMLASIATPLFTSPVDHAEESVLKEDLHVMRKAIDDFYSDHGKYPENLSELLEKRYIRQIPIDPLTQSSSTWVEVRSQESNERDGVYDVHSGSDKTDADGRMYREW